MREAVAAVRATVFWLSVRSLGRRVALLAALAAVFLLAAVAMRLVAGHGDHVEFDRFFQIGGYPLVAVLLLVGWTIGRFPTIAVLVLFAGVFSRDRDTGLARLLAVRPVPLLRVYAVRVAGLAALAFGLSALVMPLFDRVMLGTWAGPATLVLIAAQVLVYGALTAFLSVWTRADAWVALLLGLFSLVWNALRAAGLLATAPVAARELVTLALPPHGALYALEGAFAELQPIPWDAFGYAAAWAALLLVLAAWSLSGREL
jgi:hypothetical protein